MAGRIAYYSVLLTILLNRKSLVAAESWEKDSANNLVAGLTPLLGLFGERFAQQFLSESFTFQDRILFAMAPLGILTAVAGAIRVSGASWLKRLIGRARESNADVEIELLSSVSQEVCELWNGRSIVRSTGQPEIKQIIHIPAENGDISPESFITRNPETWCGDYRLRSRDLYATDNGSRKSFGQSPAMPSEQYSKMPTIAGRSSEKDGNIDPESQPPDDANDREEFEDDKEIPPNISLNIHGGSNPIELWICALVATILQLAGLVWSGFLAYSSLASRYTLFTGLKPTIGFPLQAAGTVLLTMSLILCVDIIDKGSFEREWSAGGDPQLKTLGKNQFSQVKPSNPRNMQLFWIQNEHSVGSNSVNAHILYAREPKDKIFESHYSHKLAERDQRDQRDRNDELLYTKPLLLLIKEFLKSIHRRQTEFAVLFGVLGFVAQFQGLRFLNWTCSIAQLIALIIATMLRAWVRRGMTKTPIAVPVNKDHILDHLTLAIVSEGSGGFGFPNEKAFRSPGLSLAFSVSSAPKLEAIPKLVSDTQTQPRSEPSNRERVELASSGSQPSVNPQLSTEAGTEHGYAQRALDLRVRLGHITKWRGSYSQEAITLSNSIEITLERLGPRLAAEFGEKCAVVLPIDINTSRQIHMPISRNEVESQEEVKLNIAKDSDKWKVDDAQLEALLSLVSYSAWAAEQGKKNAEKPKRQDMMNSKPSRYRTREQNMESSRSIGWLRAKPPDSRTYETVVGRRNPKLLSDLLWWIPDMERFPQKLNTFVRRKGKRTLERSILGFYIDGNVSESYDLLWSFGLAERQAFVFHLFSSFVWIAVPHTSWAKLGAAKVSRTYELNEWQEWSDKKDLQFTECVSLDERRLCLYLQVPRLPSLKSDKLEALVQELQDIGLGTSEEIYTMLIPPLSHFDRLPTADLAKWCMERVGVLEELTFLPHAFRICAQLFTAVQYRGVVDGFARHVAMDVARFLLRATDPKIPARMVIEANGFMELRDCIMNKELFEDRLLEGLGGDDRRADIMARLGF